MKDLTPQLFLSMKQYTKEQFTKDVISGIIVAIIALPCHQPALASGVTRTGALYGYYRRFHYFLFRRQQSTDRRPDSRICLNRGGYCGRTEWTG